MLILRWNEKKNLSQKELYILSHFKISKLKSYQQRKLTFILFFSNRKLNDVNNTIKLAFKRILEAASLLSSHSWSTKLLNRNSLSPAKKKTTLSPSNIPSAIAVRKSLDQAMRGTWGRVMSDGVTSLQEFRLGNYGGGGRAYGPWLRAELGLKASMGFRTSVQILTSSEGPSSLPQFPHLWNGNDTITLSCNVIGRIKRVHMWNISIAPGTEQEQWERSRQAEWSRVCTKYTEGGIQNALRTVRYT